PTIGNIKKQLYQLGASYAAMSGSGSTVYGIFKMKPSDKIKSAFDCSVFITS
ncbi:MAG: hypothetical protein KA952_00005, partial [Sediminibacterium sp.]|nr:hypothetical protein [Sediminibacterium sp.]